MLEHIKHYFIYQLIFVAAFVLMSSVGAFFHFLLDHEISVVENWLHKNTWEILVLSKILAVFLLVKWFSIRLYEFTTIRDLLKKLISSPSSEALVVSVFSLLSFIVLGKFAVSEHNDFYWYYYFASFIGSFIFYGIEFILLVYLNEVFGVLKGKELFITKLSYVALFMVGQLVTIPDYYELSLYSLFSFSLLLTLADRNQSNWSNVVCFLVVCVCPLAAIFGLDPVWGSEFSYLRFEDKLNYLLMILVWVISFCYYKFRNQLLYSYKKLKR